MRFVTLALTASLTVCLPFQSAFARSEGKLPKEAVPVTAEVAMAIFAGKTVKNSNTSVFYNADGTAVAIYPKRAFAEGSWNVKGNEVCHNLNWYGKKKEAGTESYSSCKKFYKVEKVIWTENSKDEPEWQGDIGPGFEKQIKKGDQVSKLVEIFKGQNGY